MSDGFLMEVCVDSVESAINAERGVPKSSSNSKSRSTEDSKKNSRLNSCLTPNTMDALFASSPNKNNPIFHCPNFILGRKVRKTTFVMTTSTISVFFVLRNTYGAGRLELCSSLLEGGITPSIGLLRVVKQFVHIPVYSMIRPRGGDFLYSDREVEVMKVDIELMKSNGADGLVLGVLTEDGRIDTELCVELLSFDMVRDPVVALETLISLGFERVLTSGCDISALEGLPLIKRMVEQAKGRIAIMPGGGISERNLQRILEGSGAQEFHCSARCNRDSSMKFRNPHVSMGASLSAPEYSLKVADVAKVRALNAIAKNTL